MGTYVNNDALDFAEGFKKLCSKHVKQASILRIEFQDGSSCGMRTLLEYGLGHKSIEECLKFVK